MFFCLYFVFNQNRVSSELQKKTQSNWLTLCEIYIYMQTLWCWCACASREKSTHFSSYPTLKSWLLLQTLLQRNTLIVFFSSGILENLILLLLLTSLFSCALDLHTSDIIRGNLELLKETVLCDLTLWNTHTHTYLFKEREGKPVTK